VRQRNAELQLRRLESHYAHSVTSSAEFCEIFPAGEPIVIMPPKVIGKGTHRPLRSESRSFYVSCLRNACVRGRSAITEVEGVALADFQGNELARIDDEIEFDFGVFHRQGSKVWTIADAQPVLELDEAFSLLGARTDFFGDWLCDYITRYVAATMSKRMPVVPVLIDKMMPPTASDSFPIASTGALW
jgi:hypothetical protein